MYTKELEVATNIARQAGDIMREYFWADQQITMKDDRSPLTIADTMINSMVIDQLRAAFPDDGVVGEEESTAGYGMGRRWVCDPIDGTKAFTVRVPTAMFSLALVVDGQPVVGVAYEPMLDQLYTAVSGQGSYRNGERLHVNVNHLDEGVLATTSSHFRFRTKAPFLDPLLDRHVPLTVAGGAVMACVQVANGNYAGYVEELANLHDVAAGHIIVVEAGGKVTDPFGQLLNYTAPHKGALLSNGVLHNELTEIIRQTGTGWDES